MPLYYLSRSIHSLYYILMYYKYVFLVHRHTLWTLQCSSPIPASNPSFPLLQLHWILSWFFFSLFLRNASTTFWFSFHLQKGRDKSIEVQDFTCQFPWIFIPSLPFLSSTSHTLLSYIQFHFSPLLLMNGIVRNKGSIMEWQIDQYALHALRCSPLSESYR